MALALESFTPICRALRDAHARSGLTQAQVAARAEVSDHTVARTLTGHHVHTHSLIAIAAVYGMRVSLVDAVAAQKGHDADV